MLSKTARNIVLAGSTVVATYAIAQEVAPELADASAAIEVATSAGLVETLASGDPYTAFIPSNDALATVQDAATELAADEAQLATVIQGYVVPGAVIAADAMTLVTEGGGTATVESLAGTPITLAMEGDALTANGAPVSTPDVMLGNVVIHIIDGAFLPTM